MDRAMMLPPKLYKAAKEGDVHCLSEIDGRNMTEEEEAMTNQHGNFLKRTQYGNNNILHIAARAGRDNFVAEVLCRFPFLSDQVNSQGDTPLLVAARFGHLEVVKELTKRATENGTNSSNSHHRREVGEGIIDHQSEQGAIPGSIVINMEDVINSGGMATTMEEGPVHLQLDGLIPYQWRVTNLEQGTTLTTALHEAQRNGHEDVARYLLGLKPEQAAFYNLAGESPLFLAAESRCELFMSDVLLSKRPYSTKGPDGLNVLHAAHGCCGAIISLLIKQKPDLMRQLDNRGKAAIHHAIEAEYWFLRDRMLEADASIALFPDADGYTPLLTASYRGCWSACEYILKICPESIEARDHKGRNALHLCCGSRFVKIPEIWELLNERDDEGNTPLHVAVAQNSYQKAMLLISSVSIDLGAVNKEGLTALDLCESDWMHLNKQRLMWFHLRRHGAPRGRRPNEHNVPVKGPKWIIRSPDEDRLPFINTMVVVAALIATLTFAAAFTMPGGYDSSGEANLVKKAALRVFILSDTLAMCCSIIVVSLLWKAMRVEPNLRFALTNASYLLLNIALCATLVSFMSGVFAVIAAKALWVASLACIVCSMLFCLYAPGIVIRSASSTWFMPTIISRDILCFIQLYQRRNKRNRDQRYVLSLIQRGSPETKLYHKVVGSVGQDAYW